MVSTDKLAQVFPFSVIVPINGGRGERRRRLGPDIIHGKVREGVTTYLCIYLLNIYTEVYYSFKFDDVRETGFTDTPFFYLWRR